MLVLLSDLSGRKLSDFYLEKHEYPTGSGQISELPTRLFIVSDTQEDAIEICVGPAGCSVELRSGRPVPVDMDDYGRSVILPQFRDEHLRSQSVVSAAMTPAEEGEILTMQLSDGSEISYACYGDDELRPSIDQS